MAVTNIPNVTNWSVTPQNGQAGYFLFMNTWLSESTAVIASLQTAITAQNTANSEINDLAIQVAGNAIDARNARNEALTAVATLQGGAIDNTTIAPNKAFSNQYTNNNFAKLAENQTISGIKTFSSNIVGNITGNAGSATNASKLGGNAPEYYQQALGFTPIQQGGGASQLNNKICIGWQGPYLRCQIDGTDFGTTFPMNITGNAGSATTAADSSKLIGKNWHWLGQGGQPTWLWGGSDGNNMYVYNPANFTVNYANSANTAMSLNTVVGSAPSYACRAWVNFNGTGTVTIRASGNVSSITDHGVGQYYVNFTTAMPDDRHATLCTAYNTSGNLSHDRNTACPTSPSQAFIFLAGNGLYVDMEIISFSAVR